MNVTAKLNYLRIAPRKVRLVADLIKRKKIGEAQAILNFTIKKGAAPVLKLLNSAVASAKQNFQLDPDNLYIAKVDVNEGPKLKRWMPRARGSAYEIQKKTSHITLVLQEIKETKRKIKEKKKTGKAIKQENALVEGSESATPSVGTESIKEEKGLLKTKKLRPETKTIKPKSDRGIRRIFSRKAI